MLYHSSAGSRYVFACISVCAEYKCPLASGLSPQIDLVDG